MWSLLPKGKRLICRLSNAHKGMEWLADSYRFSVCHFQGEISDVNRTKPMSSALAVNALKLCFHCHELSQLEHFISVSRRKCHALFYSLIEFFRLWNIKFTCLTVSKLLWPLFTVETFLGLELASQQWQWLCHAPITAAGEHWAVTEEKGTAKGFQWL